MIKQICKEFVLPFQQPRLLSPLASYEFRVFVTSFVVGDVDYVFGNHDDTDRYGISSGEGDQDNRDFQTGEIYVRLRLSLISREIVQNQVWIVSLREPLFLLVLNLHLASTVVSISEVLFFAGSLIIVGFRRTDRSDVMSIPCKASNRYPASLPVPQSNADKNLSWAPASEAGSTSLPLTRRLRRLEMNIGQLLRVVARGTKLHPRPVVKEGNLEACFLQIRVHDLACGSAIPTYTSAA